MPLFRSFQPGNYLSTLNIKKLKYSILYRDHAGQTLFNFFFFLDPLIKNSPRTYFNFLGHYSPYEELECEEWRSYTFFLLFFFTASSEETDRIHSVDLGLFHKRVKIYLCATGQWRVCWRINQQKPCDLKITVPLKKAMVFHMYPWQR